ncbi:MAG: hypothetical protein DHS20C16_24320 [Phycisphaerae bacterium]|nr:MAG: hypothetical protein DHS20C16_24320 [Phycisphaerae bacterium]
MCLAASMSESSAAAQSLQNGDFTDGLADWSANGDVLAVSVSASNNQYIRFEETHGDGQEPVGGRSSISQTFTIPSGTEKLSFSYRMFSSPDPRPSTVPPDSFTAFLLNTNGTARVLPSSPSAAPSFSQGFFYTDSDGAVVYDPTAGAVTVEPQAGSNGLTTVHLDVNSIASNGVPVMLEFGFASADNGVNSFVVLDGISDGSLETTYSGIVTAGVGTEGGSDSFSINVPGSVRDAYLYWSGEHTSGSADGSVDVIIDANTTGVTGTLIGGPEEFYDDNGPVYVSTYRADITSLISTGQQTVGIANMDFDKGSSGAGLVVLYHDGGAAHVEVQDGQDLAFINFSPPLNATVPKTFTFAAGQAARSASLHLFAASVEDERSNRIRVQVSGQSAVDYDDLLDSGDGPEWDTVVLPINIPAGATSLTVELISRQGDYNPASMNWILAGLELPAE